MRTPVIGVGWDSRRLLATLTTLCLVAAMMLLYAGVALADHAPPDDIVPQDAPNGSNEGPYWVNYLANERGITGATCTKISQSSESAFVMPAPPAGSSWVLLVVKQGTDNYVYYDPIGGHTYPSTGDQAPGYSHLIVCSTVDEVETTTTTSVEDTTTTSVEDTTTTSVEDTTTTSVEDTTTTSVEDTTTTSEEQTTTTTEDDPEVLPTVVTTTPDEVDDEELPFTGLDSDVMFGIAVLLFGVGAALLAITRRVEDES